MGTQTKLTKPLRIGTRASKLAVWQAEKVSRALAELNILSELVHISSEGDQVQDRPLASFGGQGVFTRALDEALLDRKIDLAVHSYKDVPTVLPDGIYVTSVFRREDPADVLVARDGLAFLDKDAPAKIATSSNRRRGQWLARYPNHEIVDIRGNVQTRLDKLDASDWGGVIFAAAGLKRLELENLIDASLDWMLPAPAQGVLAVAMRADDVELQRDLMPLIHLPTAIAAETERQFLNVLQGGCSAPVGALARPTDDVIHLDGCVTSLDGKRVVRISHEEQMVAASNAGANAARAILAKGADEIIREIRHGAE